jgi:hypothetical protein
MATMQTHTANTASRGNPALDVLLSYPLMQAIGERRTPSRRPRMLCPGWPIVPSQYKFANAAELARRGNPNCVNWPHRRRHA